MKRLSILPVLLIAAALAGCSGEEAYDDMAASAPMADEELVEADAIMVTGSRKAGGGMAPVGQGDSGEEPAGGRLLAYEYSATLQVPAASVGTLMTHHMERCQAAGPATCQVISSYQNRASADYANASLELRATRDWLTGFRGGLEGDAGALDGRVTATNMTAEDLTRAITDTRARLEAQETLRDRLLLLLERDTDDVGDLVEIERELARVQGEIESARSWLRILEARVSMERMSLSYQTLPSAVSVSTFGALGDAFTAFFRVLADSLAALVLFIAAALPWLIVIIPVLWILSRLIRGWFRKRRAG